MASHRRMPHLPKMGVRGLLLSGRDVLVLAICALGLLTAWLAYGINGAYGTDGAGTPPAAQSSSQVSAAPTLTSGPKTPEPSVSAQGQPSSDSAGGNPPPLAQAPPGTPTTPPAAEGSNANQGVAVPAASAPLRITYPAADMDVAIHPLEPDGGAAGSHGIEPPETKDGYWLVPFGSPGAGSTNTTYVVGHSWVDQDAPFNHLSWAATPGDELTVTTATGVLTYRVDEVTTYSKSTLKDSPIWAVVPNRLVLVSCYSQDPWGRNVTVMASPIPGR